VTETHSAHNAEAAGSNPAPATNKNHPPLPFAAPPHKGERRTESPAPTRSVGAGHLNHHPPLTRPPGARKGAARNTRAVPPGRGQTTRAAGNTAPQCQDRPARQAPAAPHTTPRRTQRRAPRNRPAHQNTRRKSTWLPPEQAQQNGCESDDKQSNKQSKTTSSTAQHAALDSTMNTHANPTAPRSTTSSRTVAAAKIRSQTRKSSVAGATNARATGPNAANRWCRNG